MACEWQPHCRLPPLLEWSGVCGLLLLDYRGPWDEAEVTEGRVLAQLKHDSRTRKGLAR